MAPGRYKVVIKRFASNDGSAPSEGMDSIQLRLAGKRSEDYPRVSWKMLCALPLAHVVYFACLASASVMGRVSWRGITYEFTGPWSVRMRKYRPYLQRNRTDQRASVV